MLAETEQVQRKLATKVVIHEEDSEDDDPDKAEGIHVGNERVLDVSLQKQQDDIVDKLLNMNSNMRNFSADVEDKLKKAYKAGNYDKKFGYEGLSTKNMDEDWESKSAISASANSMSTFEKILHKDNKKLNRLQNQARNYISTSGGHDPLKSVMSASSRLSSAHSQGTLPDVHAGRKTGGGLHSARLGALPLGVEAAMRTSTGGPGSVKGSRAISNKSSSSFK